MYNNLRLDKAEIKALYFALFDIQDEVYAFGSRLNKSKKGGDIDLLVFSKENPLKLSQKIKRIFFLHCEEKIDVVVFDKESLTEEQSAFLNTLNIKKIK